MTIMKGRRRRRTCDTSKDSTGAVFQTRSRRTFTLAWSTRIGVVSVGVGVFLASKGYAFVSPFSVKPSLPRSRESSSPSPKSGAGETYMSERRGLWPSRQTIDLRSDTVTQPTAGMRKSMHKSEVGDDVFGEDPTVKRLEAETAEMLGKEAALFVPSGTMANLISHLVWCSQRGSEMILGDQSHSFLWEQANAAQFGGIGYRALENLPDGTIDLQQIEAAVRGNNPCFPVSRLVSIENTQAQCGGKVLPIEYLDELGQLAQAQGLRVHMDGARLWNAAAALRLPPARLVAGVDSVSVCYSKGLSAPVGSAVVGSADFVGRAMRVRKALGGGMRQSGVVAAAALEGLRKQFPRIGDDNTNAKRLAQGIQELGVPNAVSVDPDGVHSNIVLMTVGPELSESELGLTASVMCERLRDKGVLALAVMPGVIRFVTHCQITSHDVHKTVAVLKTILEEAGLELDPLRRLPPSSLPPTEGASVQAESLPPPGVSDPLEAGVSGAEDVDEVQPPQVPAPAAAAAPVNGHRIAVESVSASDPPAVNEYIAKISKSSAVEERTGIFIDVGVGAGPEAPDANAAPAPVVGVEEDPVVSSDLKTDETLGKVPMPGGQIEMESVGSGEVPQESERVGAGKVDEQEEPEQPAFLESFEEVQLQEELHTEKDDAERRYTTIKESRQKGVTGSTEGFVAVLTSKESGRALRLVVTPDDPMSGGLDLEQAETSEARTLLQLMQGIDVARHLRNDALGTLMEVPRSSGVQLSKVCVLKAKPFEAELTAKIPHKDSEVGSPAAVDPTIAATAPGTPGGVTDGVAAAVGSSVSPVPVGPTEQLTSGGVVESVLAGGEAPSDAGSPEDRDPSAASPAPPVLNIGRPRVGMTKEATTKSSFEALGLTLRYQGTKIYVRSELLSQGASDPDCSFDASEIPELYPNLLNLEEVRARKSAADEMEGQFEAIRLRQQLENAMNAGDADRITSLKEQLNKLVVSDADIANAP